MDRHNRLSRRQFVAGAGASGLGLLAGCGRLPWEVPAQVQPAPTKVPRIGALFFFLTPSTPEAEALRQGLREWGYVEGQNILIEWRSAEGNSERVGALVAELLALPVDLLVTAGGTIQAAKDATTTLPIIMASGPDPVAAGYVPSLARPGGNLTGLSPLLHGLVGKRLQLLLEVVPTPERIGVLWDPAAAPIPDEWQDLTAGAQALDVQLLSLEAHGRDGLEQAFATARREGVSALIALSNIVGPGSELIAELALQQRLPAIFHTKLLVSAGGLMSYGPNRLDSYRRAAYYVDRILKGAKPADLPVEQPMTFEFVVNLKTAQALGITFPPEILLQVTEAIQ